MQQENFAVFRQLGVELDHRVTVARANVNRRQRVFRRQLTAAAVGDDMGIRPVAHTRCPVSPSNRCRWFSGRCSHSVLPAFGRS